MSRRLATVILHWSNLILLFLLLAAGGDQPVLAWAFALVGLSMVGLAIVKGVMNGPGPKLQGFLRSTHPWLSRMMYLLLAWAALTILTAQIGSPLPGPGARQALLALLGAGLLHGCFHLWRASALNDGALRRMLP
jgi:hypothetical protein